MPLRTATTEIFGQLTDVISQLDSEDYACRLNVLSGNTIGKHVRHILEFYDLLVSSHATGQLNYDRRERDLLLEISPDAAIRRIARINHAIQHLDLDRRLHLEAELGAEPVQIPSSFARELLYNIEHAIHHMALIQVAVRDSFLHIVLPPNFGVAYSTVQHQTNLTSSPA
jgi:uncharacterized damage-inducible protein DinB